MSWKTNKMMQDGLW